MEEALKIKMEGTESFKIGDIQGAINKYSLALAVCPDKEDSDRKQKALIHSNIGLCLVKLYEHEPAEKPETVKKLFPDPQADEEHPLV